MDVVSLDVPVTSLFLIPNNIMDVRSCDVGARVVSFSLGHGLISGTGMCNRNMAEV